MVAALLDLVIVAILTLTLSLVAAAILGVGEAPLWMLQQAGRVVFLAVWFGYFARLEARPEGTLGQSSLKLAVVDVQGRRLSPLRATLRAVGKLTLFWTWPAVLFDRRRRAGYDWIVGAIVADRRAPPTRESSKGALQGCSPSP